MFKGGGVHHVSAQVLRVFFIFFLCVCANVHARVLPFPRDSVILLSRSVYMHNYRSPPVTQRVFRHASGGTRAQPLSHWHIINPYLE